MQPYPYQLFLDSLGHSKESYSRKSYTFFHSNRILFSTQVVYFFPLKSKNVDFFPLGSYIFFHLSQKSYIFFHYLPYTLFHLVTVDFFPPKSLTFFHRPIWTFDTCHLRSSNNFVKKILWSKKSFDLPYIFRRWGIWYYDNILKV